MVVDIHTPNILWQNDKGHQYGLNIGTFNYSSCEWFFLVWESWTEIANQLKVCFHEYQPLVLYDCIIVVKCNEILFSWLFNCFLGIHSQMTINIINACS